MSSLAQSSVPWPLSSTQHRFSAPWPLSSAQHPSSAPDHHRPPRPPTDSAPTTTAAALPPSHVALAQPALSMPHVAPIFVHEQPAARCTPNKLRKPPRVEQPLFTDLNLDHSRSGTRPGPRLFSQVPNYHTAASWSESPSSPLHSSPLTSHSIFTLPHPHSIHGGSFPPPNASLSRSTTSTSTRKLSKRRPSLLATIPQALPVPPSSSHEAAYAAARASQPFLMSHTPPSYTQSDIGHGSTNLTPKRGSIIRRFSMLTKKQDNPSASAARAKWTRWKRSKDDSHLPEEQAFLPLLRVVSPFSVAMPEQLPLPQSSSWGTTVNVLQDADPGSSSSAADPLSSMSSPATTPPTADPPRTRPKFTLSNESDADLSSDHHFSTASSFSRPPLVRRDASVGTVAYGTQRRRWTLAMAMTDEDITDEVLVEELERVVLKMKSQWTGSLDDIPAGFGIWDADVGREIWESSLQSYLARDGDVSDAGHSADGNAWGQVIHESPLSDSELSSGTKIPYTPSLPSFPLQHRLSTPAPVSTATWQTARRALLTCRELVRTERHYLTSLQGLVASETLTPPPPQMLDYAGELLKVSEGLLARMEENPSAWGVAAAFLGKEEGVETAFVGWCSVVATWFVDESDADRGRGSSRSASRKSSPVRRKLSKPSISDDKDKKAEADEEGTLMSPLKRTVSTWRKSMTSIPSLDSGSSSPHFLSKRKEKERERKVSAPAPTTTMAPTTAPPLPTQSSSKRKPAVRDLAILPTQRVMRYVLLYRDLLAHTPSTSPSRALVERAVEAACRIAQKCDRAQGNAVFDVPKVDTTSTKASRSNSSSLSTGGHSSSRRKLTLSMTPMSSRSRADQNAEL